MKIIFAQGNPEPGYTTSRHNIGFQVLNIVAESSDAKWTKKPKFYAFAAEIKGQNDKILLVKPTTYYNDTGKTARKLVDFYKLDAQNDLLVIHDDLSIPFGIIRVRQKGSDGGNNGIKSINANIGPSYTRIRIGIYNQQRDQRDDADFVLSPFNRSEQKILKETIIPAVEHLVCQFYTGKLETDSYKLLD